ncbi:MAG: 50S ribosomal protein L20 [SAR202 cluster bacterium]|nr:MAG: 50S ribosomal protein L20 [SAR202 cluster bacterium]MCH2318547.1 50S ribosomal protein L20 [SAR202 cluster bacterium]MQF68028.1 50S ribosomal protein L20 [SAR202 cluster bacterium AD-802-K11_MRT_200m]MQG74822.1 50S ribosomal protein L20 [SAR202 cluster bacterium]
MTRVKTGVIRRRRHKKTLGMTKGHQGVRHRLYRRAHESLIHAGQYAFDHRKKKKGDMRRLWNIRINAGARANGVTYSKLIHGLRLAGIEINRKMLAELAVSDEGAFSEIVSKAQASLEAEAA